jgi:Tfp pilus assembly protein PilV
MLIKDLKLRTQNLKNEGQSMFEVMFALAISALVLVAIVSVAAFSLRNATFSKNKAQANKFAAETDTWLKIQRDFYPNWSDFYDQALPDSPNDTVWCLKTLNWTSPTFKGSCTNADFITGTDFIRQMSVSDQDAGKGLKFTTTVSWNDSVGGHSTTTTTVLTNW